MSLLLPGAVLLLFLAVACASEGGASEAPLPNEVSSAIEHVRGGKSEALGKQAVFLTVECTVAEGMGGPPKCESGQPEGTEVEVMPAASCEGFYIPHGSEGPTFASFLDGDVKLDALYRRDADDFFPAGYALLFSFSSSQFPDEHARALFLSDQGVTGLFFGCNHTIQQLQSAYTTGEAIWSP